MSDQEHDADETPAQRALRLRKSAMAAKPKPPGAGGVPRAAASRIGGRTSKPAIRK